MQNDPFGNLDLQSELDKEAFSLLNNDNSDLAFGGSSPEQAAVFGADINANDAPRIGAFLGGVALANLATQQNRQQRFERIRSLQEEIVARQNTEIRRDTLTETARANDLRSQDNRFAQEQSSIRNNQDNLTSIANNQNSNNTSRQNNIDDNQRSRDNNFTTASTSGFNNVRNNRTSEANNIRTNASRNQDPVVPQESVNNAIQYFVSQGLTADEIKVIRGENNNLGNQQLVNEARRLATSKARGSGLSAEEQRIQSELAK